MLFVRPNMFKFIKYLAFFLIFSIAITSCGNKKFGDTRKTPVNAQERARKNVEEGRGVSIGNIIGGLLSFLGLFLTAFIGIFLIRLLSKKVFSTWQSEYQLKPFGLSRFAEGVSILFGGILLIIPGYFTDLIGTVCMVPILRIYIGSIIIANFADHRFFTNLRKKHEDNFHYTDDTEKNTHNIIIDGDYKEK